MKAICMNSVPEEWVRAIDQLANTYNRVNCGFEGEVPKVEGQPCPRCSQVGTMSEVVGIQLVEPPEIPASHVDCPCWATGKFKWVGGCSWHPTNILD